MPQRIFASPEAPHLVEGIVVDAFTPGQLIERTVSSGITQLETTNNSATTFGNEFLVAKEVPSTLDSTLITEPWTVGDVGETIAPRSGQLVWLSMANTQNILRKGVAIGSNGDGNFKIAVIPATVGATSEQVYAYSEQILNVTVAGTLLLCRTA